MQHGMLLSVDVDAVVVAVVDIPDVMRRIEVVVVMVMTCMMM